MANNFKLDTLDRRILRILTADARIPFVEVARKCKVSGAAVHQRMARMTEGRTGIYDLCIYWHTGEPDKYQHPQRSV